MSSFPEENGVVENGVVETESVPDGICDDVRHGLRG